MEKNDQARASAVSDFPIFGGGPLYRLQQRTRLVRDDRRRIGLAALYVALVAWVPMAFLAGAQGLAIGPTRLESFLLDFSEHARFLVTIPVFLYAELICGAQLRDIVRQFEDAGLVVEEAGERFKQLVQETVRLSHSSRAEMVILGLAFIHGLFVFLYLLNYPEPTWRLVKRDGGHVPSYAGVWYFLVAFPMYSFLLMRWFWRIGLWWRFLGRVSKLELNLSPAHRDGAGGLGFLSESLSAFTGFVFGVMATAAGVTADFVVYGGDSPLTYEWEVGGLLVLLMSAIAGPLMLFTHRLYEAKESALFRYGALANRHIQQVDRKWLSGRPFTEDVGIDFRAVAHMGSSVNAVRQMSIVPLYKDDLLKLIVVALLPFLPLLATLVPMDEVLKLVLKMVV
ncbi:MAG: hypothetical protein CV088_15495 [Nitrospira sp. LK70]|nr:hypothetical protein [Nitrospira sp. LK70]